MKSLKITLIALIALLAIAVGYGYGCGGNDDKSGDDSTAAAQADSTSAETGADSTGSADGGDSTEASGDGDSSESTDGGDSTGSTDGADSTGSGADGNSSSAPLTKAQFVKKADAICENVPVRYRKLLGEFEKEQKKQGKPKPSVAESNLAAAVPPLPEAAEELEALNPPSGDEQKVEAMIAALDAAAEGLEKKPNSALSGPQSPFDEFQKLTKAYGLTACSQL